MHIYVQICINCCLYLPIYPSQNYILNHTYICGDGGGCVKTCCFCCHFLFSTVVKNVKILLRRIRSGVIWGCKLLHTNVWSYSIWFILLILIYITFVIALVMFECMFCKCMWQYNKSMLYATCYSIGTSACFPSWQGFNTHDQ